MCGECREFDAGGGGGGVGATGADACGVSTDGGGAGGLLAIISGMEISCSTAQHS